MDVSDLSDIVTKELASMGGAGAAIAVLLVTIVVLWRSLQKERARCEALVNLMLKQSKETQTMIERITGR